VKGCHVKSGVESVRLHFFVGFLIFLVLSFSPTIVNAGNTEQQLFSAIHQHDLEAVENLLKSRVDPNLRNSAALISFQTPLSLAVSLGDAEIVALLIEYGADVNLCVGFWHNISPLYIATDKGNLVIVQQLITAGAKIDPNRWTALKDFFTAPWHLLQGDVIDLSRPPSLLDAAQKSGNHELYRYLKEQDAR
jgi:hypothetical protein